MLCSCLCHVRTYLCMSVCISMCMSVRTYVYMHVVVYAGASSHGSCKPIDEYPTALRGPCSWGEDMVPPLPTGPPFLLPPSDSPPEWGPCSQI